MLLGVICGEGSEFVYRSEVDTSSIRSLWWVAGDTSAVRQIKHAFIAFIACRLVDGEDFFASDNFLCDHFVASCT